GDESKGEYDDEHGRLGERSNHHLAARADAAEAGADIKTCKRQEEASAAEQRDDSDKISGPREQESTAEGWHQRRRDPGAGEDDVRNDAEQPGGVLRQHDLLAHQSDQIAIGLQQRRTLTAQQPRLHLADETGEQWREQQHQQHLPTLEEEIVRQDHIANTSSRKTSAAKTNDR